MDKNDIIKAAWLSEGKSCIAGLPMLPREISWHRTERNPVLALPKGIRGSANGRFLERLGFHCKKTGF